MFHFKFRVLRCTDYFKRKSNTQERHNDNLPCLLISKQHHAVKSAGKFAGDPVKAVRNGACEREVLYSVDAFLTVACPFPLGLREKPEIYGTPGKNYWYNADHIQL